MPERVVRPERILWRPDEVEDFDEEFQSIVWIEDTLKSLSSLPLNERTEKLKLSLQTALGSTDREVLAELRKGFDPILFRRLQSENGELSNQLIEYRNSLAEFRRLLEVSTSSLNWYRPAFIIFFVLTLGLAIKLLVYLHPWR